MTTVALVGCGNAKQAPEDCPVPAKDLYTSGYFGLKWEHARRETDDQAILSAKFGVLLPTARTPWYDETLETNAESRVWAVETAPELRAWLDWLDAETVEFLAGANYYRSLVSRLPDEVTVRAPLSGVGLFEQQSALSTANEQRCHVAEVLF